MNLCWKSNHVSMEFLGKFMYHLSAASFKVPESSLHFKCSAAPMMAICVLTAIRCSVGSVFPSNYVPKTKKMGFHIGVTNELM
jgi:hypothetical protein